MQNEAMKELVKNQVQCVDETIGRFLVAYQNAQMNEKSRIVFNEHLCECKHCMGLLLVETRFLRRGYISAQPTGLRYAEWLLWFGVRTAAQWGNYVLQQVNAFFSWLPIDKQLFELSIKALILIGLAVGMAELIQKGEAARVRQQNKKTAHSAKRDMPAPASNPGPPAKSDTILKSVGGLRWD